MKVHRWMRVFSIILIVTLLLPYPGGASAPAAPLRESNLTGRVVTPDGVGVAGVTVRAHSGAAVVISPSAVIADGVDIGVVTILGATPGHKLRLVSSRGSLDVFGDPTGQADSHGVFSTTIQSTRLGMARVSVKDLDSGETLDASDSVVFTDESGSGSEPGEEPGSDPGSEPGSGDTPPNPDPTAIVITAIKPKLPLDGRYFEGLEAENTIQVSIDWKGKAAGQLEYKVNGQKNSAQVISNPTELTLQMDQILKAGVNTLDFVAVSGDGKDRSAPKSFSPRLMALPEWLSGLQVANMLSKFLFRSVEATSEFKIPKDPIQFNGGASEIQFGVGGGATLSLRCEQAAKFNLSASGGGQHKLKSITLGGSLTVQGEVTAGAVNCWIPTAEGTVQVTVTVFGQKDWPLPVFVAEFINPAVAGALDALTGQVVGDATLNLFGKIYVRAEVNGSISSGVTFIPQSPYVEWKQLTVGVGLKPEAGYQFNALGVELKTYLALNGNIAQTIPTITDFALNKWSQYSISGEAGFEFAVPLVDCSYKRVYSVGWNYDTTASPPDSVEVNQLTNHDCASTDPRLAPAVFTARGAALQAFDRVLPSADQRVSTDAPIHFLDAQTASSVLMSDVYGRAEPALAVRADGQALMMWVYNDPGKPVPQSKEIYFSLWNGSAWSTPAAVTNDTYLDGRPRVAWNSAGQAVAIWQRLPETQSALAWNESVAGKIEIATATYDPSTGTWSAPVLLTTNPALDLEPQLARSPDGKLLATWRQNASGKLAGSAANPDGLMTAGYDTAWSTPSAAAVNLPGARDLYAAYGTNAATLAYVQAVTPSGGGDAVDQIFTLAWDGSAWGAPQQQTNAAVAARAPRLAYTAANQPVLVWMSADGVYLRNLAGGETVSMSVPPEVGSVDELSIVQNAAGSIAAVFSAQTATRRDLYLAFYDQEHNLWGSPRKLSDDSGIEKYPAPALDESGRLLVGYTSTIKAYETHAMMAGDGGDPLAVEVPVDGRTDLVTLSHTFNRNLTLGSGDLSLANPAPLPGDTLTLIAQVHNSGDLAVSGISVAFYDGDPAGGGSLIGTTTSLETLAAGASLALSTDLPFAEDGEHTYYALLDPAGAVTESNEGDNVTSLVAFTPDLAVSAAWGEYWGGREVGLLATIQNVGVSPAPAANLSFYRVSQPGVPLATVNVPALEPGQSAEVTAPWQTTGLDAGDYELQAVLTPQGFTESVTTNNTRKFLLVVRPDLMVNTDGFWVVDWKASPRQVKAVVYNTGPVDAANVVVTLYNQPTLTAANAVAAQTIASLPANSATTLTFSVSQDVPCAFYLLVNSDRSLLESSFENNLVSVINPSGICAPGPTGCQPVGGIKPSDAREGCEGPGPIAAYLPMVARPQTGLADGRDPDLPLVPARLVTSEDPTTTTDANGYYTFENLPDGVYQILPSKSGYRFTPLRRVFTLPASGPLELGFVAKAITVKLDAMVTVLAGSFMMGCSPAHNSGFECIAEWPTTGQQPLHTVMLDTYRIDKYEVTNARYARCVTAGACTPPHDVISFTRTSYYDNPAYANYPVVQVDWFQASAFCAWEGKRLPTEAEWEKAARGTGLRTFPWGDTMPNCTLANAGDYTTGTLCLDDTAAVGSYPAGASPYNVMDMGGNVWEWVYDWVDIGYYAVSPASNPTGPDSGIGRGIRGGNKGGGFVYARTAFRGVEAPERISNDLGFRCAASGGQ